MVALFFLLLGSLVFLVVAARLWMNAPPDPLKESNVPLAGRQGRD